MRLKYYPILIKRRNIQDEGKRLIRKTIISCLFLTVIIITGCSKVKDKTSSEQFQADYMEVFGRNVTRTKTGDFQVREGLIYFTDYNTQTCIPVCSKPDCRHLSVYEDEDTTCNAVCDGGLVFPYDGKLYRILSEDSGRKSKLVASDMDGSNPKAVGTFYSGDLFDTAVVVENKMYYVCLELKETSTKDIDQMSAMELTYMLNSLNLDTLEQEQIMSKSGAQNLILLGGTKYYQIYVVAEDGAVEYYLFDYKTENSKRIYLNTNDYRSVTVAKDRKSFYYAGDEGKKIYRYNVETGENVVIVDVNEIEVENAGNAVGTEEQSEKTVYAEGVCEEGLLFRIFPQNELYLQSENGIRNLKLSQRLQNDQAWLSGVETVTQTGIYFTYQAENVNEKNIDGDLLIWYAYIDMEDLFNDRGDIKVIHTPRVSSAGNIVDIAN